MRIIAVVITLMALITFTVAPVSARSPHHVDPASVTPPLSSDFLDLVCWQTGNGIICEGSLVESYVNEDFGLRCDDDVIWVSGTLSDRVTRWHTADGRATRTVGMQSWRETWSLSTDGSGPTLEVSGRSIRHYTYFVPGDPSQRQLVESGATILATAPGIGVVVRDAGRIIYDVGAANDFQNPIEFRGPHPSWTDWDAAVQRACGALGA